jgi:hypothetical protein
MITVGDPSFLTWDKIRRLGLARALYDSIIDKIGLVAINIKSDINGMCRHPIFDTYVKDKQRIVSYYLGMAFAKFYSERLLYIPNLVHVEFLKKHNAIAFSAPAGGKRHREPDLIGKTADNHWHVFEAKGTSTSESSLGAKIKDAKDQATQISTIDGKAPQTHTACATYIGSDRIFSLLEDPSSEQARAIEIDQRAFFNAYYTPFLLANQYPGITIRNESIGGLEVEIFDIARAERRLSFGLVREIAEHLREQSYEAIPFITERLSRLSNIQKEGYSIGLDGFVVGYS